MRAQTINERSRLARSTRDFFLSRDYLEVDTPILSPNLIPESCLEIFSTEFVKPFSHSIPLYLVPSPEIWMKKIIAETKRNVFQIGRAFRNAESMGKYHNPEFTMLEYYTINATSKDNIGLTESLFQSLSVQDTPSYAKPPFRRMTMAEAFREFACLDLDSLIDEGSMVEALKAKGLIVPTNPSWEEAFNVLFLSLVEPALPMDRPLVLDEYPSGIECLAKDIPGTPYKERWELYVRGIEVANCYSEQTDFNAASSYFITQQEKKSLGLIPHQVDMAYPSLLASLPPSSGVAIGFDRLAMVLLECEKIEDVMFFPFSSFLGSRADAL
jgi:lysyl-tRNA synthetase class 2